jgi:HK97 family phage major capsid protein
MPVRKERTTMNATLLKTLWEKRNEVAAKLNTMAEQASDRAYTPEEQQQEERMLKELGEVDAKIQKGLDEAEREKRSDDAFKRYEHLTDSPNIEMPDFLRNDQSVAKWAERNLPGSEYQGGFDNYIRDLLHGKTWEQRDMNEGTLTAGGHLVPTPVASQVIDLARNKSRVFQAGAVTVPMTEATLKFPRLTGEGSPAWHSENATITSADLTLDSVTLTARTLTRLVVASIELVDDAPQQTEGLIGLVGICSPIGRGAMEPLQGSTAPAMPSCAEVVDLR